MFFKMFFQFAGIIVWSSMLTEIKFSFFKGIFSKCSQIKLRPQPKAGRGSGPSARDIDCNKNLHNFASQTSEFYFCIYRDIWRPKLPPPNNGSQVSRESRIVNWLMLILISSVRNGANSTLFSCIRNFEQFQSGWGQLHGHKNFHLPICQCDWQFTISG